MESEMRAEEARRILAELLQKTGLEDSGLLDYLDELEHKCKRLEEENKRHRDAAHRRAASASSMNSRLKDALRE